jgi:hypothetical protein
MVEVQLLGRRTKRKKLRVKRSKIYEYMGQEVRVRKGIKFGIS